MSENFPEPKSKKMLEGRVKVGLDLSNYVIGLNRGKLIKFQKNLMKI